MPTIETLGAAVGAAALFGLIERSLRRPKPRTLGEAISTINQRQREIHAPPARVTISDKPSAQSVRNN